MFTSRRRGTARASTIGAIVVLALGFAACSGSDSDSANSTTALPTSTVAEAVEAETTIAATPASDGGDDDGGGDITVAESDAGDEDATADRPYDVFVPSGYDPTTPVPLILLLHGYTASGEIQESYFEFEPLAESRGFLYVHPDGTVDANGARFWNATDACCAFGSNPPDDVAYLMSIIEEVSAEYSVDPKAVFLAGHSNGGFMSYRMACEQADTIAGIASLAGATFADTTDCAPSESVSVLQVHGTDDETIAYNGGGIIGTSYPSARETVESWVAYNECDSTSAITTDVLDLDGSIEGSESDAEVFGSCENGAVVELWTIDAGSHIPDVTEDFSAAVVDFLLAHPKP